MEIQLDRKFSRAFCSRNLTEQLGKLGGALDPGVGTTVPIPKPKGQAQPRSEFDHARIRSVGGDGQGRVCT